MADNRCVRIYDLKQRVQYHPEVGTYVSEEDIDLMERVSFIGGIEAEFIGQPFGFCYDCLHVEEDMCESRKGRLNCPMWGATGINPDGFCYMWKQKNN